MIQRGIDVSGRCTWLGQCGQLMIRLCAWFKKKHRESPKKYRAPSTNDAGAELAGRLLSYINLRPPQKDANIPVIIHANKVSMKTRMQSPDSVGEVAVMPNSFSQALSESHTTDLLHKNVGHKLVQSALDHLNTSIRYAKAGDTESARLHAGIMDSALKEAAHYASEDEYQELVKILDKELNRLS